MNAECGMMNEDKMLRFFNSSFIIPRSSFLSILYILVNFFPDATQTRPLPQAVLT